jgi:CheY-like chemotaxis protein
MPGDVIYLDKPKRFAAVPTASSLGAGVGVMTPWMVGGSKEATPRLVHPKMETTACSPGQERGRLLIAEDDKDIRFLLELRLRRAGFEITVATDGEEALRIVRSEPPDLVLLDVAMPVLDGLSMLDQMRAHPETSDLPVVLLSATVDESQIRDGLRRGANAYLKKPFQLEELLTTIELLLRHR